MPIPVQTFNDLIAIRLSSLLMMLCFSIQSRHLNLKEDTDGSTITGITGDGLSPNVPTFAAGVFGLFAADGLVTPAGLSNEIGTLFPIPPCGPTFSKYTEAI